MMDTMAEYHGVGLAAPQVHESLRLFVGALDPTQPDPDDDEPLEPFAIINPEITPMGEETIDDWEGCLSIPDIRGRVPRFTGRSRSGRRTGEASASSCASSIFKARVVQHETDHLDGVLFFDRMRSFNSLTFLDEYSRYWVKDKD